MSSSDHAADARRTSTRRTSVFKVGANATSSSSLRVAPGQGTRPNLSSVDPSVELQNDVDPQLSSRPLQAQAFEAAAAISDSEVPSLSGSGPVTALSSVTSVFPIPLSVTPKSTLLRMVMADRLSPPSLGFLSNFLLLMAEPSSSRILSPPSF